MFSTTSIINTCYLYEFFKVENVLNSGAAFQLINYSLKNESQHFSHFFKGSTSVVTKTQTQIHIKQIEMFQSFLMSFCFGHQDEMKGDTCLLS